MFRFIHLIVLFAIFLNLLGGFVAVNAAPAGYRLPFVGTYRITAGPGCYITHQHRSSEAIDFAMSVGTPIYATQSGQIISAVTGWNDGFGRLLKIQHDDGNLSWYAHLSQFVRTSGRVNQGDLVAYSGNDGQTTGPHLHFEVRNSGNQSIWIRDLPGIRWYSGNPSNPCQPPGQDDGQAVGPPLGTNTSCAGPSLNSPSAGQMLRDRRVTFSWQSPGCGQGYTLRIKDTSSMDSGGTTIFDQGVGETSRTVDIPEQWVNRTLYWGVRAANVANANWSVRSFQVQLSDPGTTTCNPTADQVALYEHTNYTGRCTTLGIGAYRDAGSMNLTNDSASSIRVGGNVRATVYEHSDYGGRSETFTGDDPSLIDNVIGNDVISSVRVERRTSNDACAGPPLSAPGDGVTLSDPNVAFSWGAPSGCSFQGYTFRIKDTPSMEQGGTVLVDTGVGQTSIQRSIPAEWHNRDLYWGVRTANPLSSNWSVRRFRIEPRNSGEIDPQAISSGQSIDARIDPANEDDTFTFAGAQGQVALITMERTDNSNLDSYVELFGPTGLVGYNDDSNGTLNSRLEVTLPQTGSYRILAHSYARSTSGAYRIRLTLGAPSAMDGDDGRWLSFGQTLRGAISPSTDRDTYYFNAVAGRTVSLRMIERTPSLDSYLELYDPSGSKIAENDDSGGDYNSWLVATLPSSGAYRIVARSYNGASSGEYTISLDAMTGNNLARGKAAVASSIEGNNTAFAPTRATDGDASTRWSSEQSEGHWIYVDLGSEQTINQVVLRWERAFADRYDIFVYGSNYSTWHRVYSTENGDGNVDTISFAPLTARYVMMYGRRRFAHDGWQQFGYSLWEFEVYNTLSALVPTVPPDNNNKPEETLVPLIPLPPDPIGKDPSALGQGAEQESAPPRSEARPESPLVIPGEIYGPPSTGIALSTQRAVAGRDEIRFVAVDARDSDESGAGIMTYRWTSNIDGFLGTTAELVFPAACLSVGLHTITLAVQDNEGSWSAPVTAVLEILPSDTSGSPEYYTVRLPLVQR